MIRRDCSGIAKACQLVEQSLTACLSILADETAIELCHVDMGLALGVDSVFANIVLIAFVRHELVVLNFSDSIGSV